MDKKTKNLNKGKILVWGVIIIFSLSAQSERWVEKYLPPGKPYGAGFAITYNNGFLYINGEGRAEDEVGIAVWCVDTSGELQWCYYNPDYATEDYLLYTCTTDENGNIYATSRAIISLDAHGHERWVYPFRYPHEITYRNGKIYVSGTSGYPFADRVRITCLDTSGNHLWTYLSPQVGTFSFGFGHAIDSEGNIYAVGKAMLYPPMRAETLIVLSVDSLGNLRWIDKFEPDTTTGADEALMFADIGPDGNIYVMGYSYELGQDPPSIIVASYTPEGVRRWFYYYDGYPQYHGARFNTYRDDQPICFDPNGNFYITGYVYEDNTYGHWDILVLSLSPSGEKRWEYVTDLGGDIAFPEAQIGQAICCDSFGNIYVTGGAEYDTLVGDAWICPAKYFIICLDTLGNEKWVYCKHFYNKLGDDVGWDIIQGEDGYLYSCGFTQIDAYTYEMLLLSFDPYSTGSEEKIIKYNPPFSLSLYPTIVKDKISLSIEGTIREGLKLILFDQMGRKIWERNIFPGKYQISLGRKIKSSGIFFLNIYQGRRLLKKFKIVK